MDTSKILDKALRAIELCACAFLLIMTLALIALAGSCLVCIFTDFSSVGISLLGMCGCLIIAALSWGAFIEFRHGRA